LLPAGAVAGWDLHPLESAAFSRRTPEADITERGLVPTLVSEIASSGYVKSFSAFGNMFTANETAL